MTAALCEPTVSWPWRRIRTGDDAVAVAERNALGTNARVVVWPPEGLDPARIAVDGVLDALDYQASRFRPDSEISRINGGGGGLFMLSDGLAQAVGVALAAAHWTGGLTDPTVGAALISLGYDRDFAAIDADRREAVPPPTRAPGWSSVELAGCMLRMPAAARLDLGATAKGLGSDRAVRAAMRAISAGGPAVAAGVAAPARGGVLVELGGDIAVAGTPPRDGWPVTVADPAAGTSPVKLVRLPAGAIATSSTTCRRWRRAGRALHHIVDPRTGLPADGPWQMATVAAATCADANAAATAAIVAGHEAVGFLTAAGLPARIAGHDGSVRYLGGWPDADGGQVIVPPGTRVYGGPVRLGGRP
jgi:thiamine biosynthesis lipoprotein